MRITMSIQAANYKYPERPAEPQKDDFNSFFINVMNNNDLIGSFVIFNSNDNSNFDYQMEAQILPILQNIDPEMTYVEHSPATWDYFIRCKGDNRHTPPWKGSKIRYYRSNVKKWHYLEDSVVIHVSDFFFEKGYIEAKEQYLKDLDNFEIEKAKVDSKLKIDLQKKFSIDDKLYHYFRKKYISNEQLIKEIENYSLVES